MITFDQSLKNEVAEDSCAMKITLYLSSLITLLAIVTLF
jgi:hypothetical protein